MKPVEIVLVYQSLLGIYGDRGNAMVLRQRLAWRGIEAVLTEVDPGDEVPSTGAVYLLGGGEDAAQISAVRALKADGHLFEAIEAGAVLFAVCAGYQIVGKTFTVGEHDEVIQGLGLLDVETRRGPERAVGEVLSAWTRPDGTESLVTGFENHGGFTYLGADAEPLARMEIGVGNCGDGTDGAVQGNVLGIYPHGPILARNPELADHLLERALGRELDPLPNPELDELRRQRIAAVRKAGLRR
ncbi:MAG: glutamine amidotransferase [Propionibacteriaceae bacterium]|nr:glutamine amidotransferase [Propionibacteriaceae bacterium]